MAGCANTPLARKPPRLQGEAGSGKLRVAMDPITHALSGAVVARLIRSRVCPSTVVQPVLLVREGRFAAAWDSQARAIRPWQAVCVGMLAAAFPDIDVLAHLGGDLAYLRHHRGITHSVLLAPLWAWLIAAVMQWVFAELRQQRGGWKGLYVPALAGILIHIAGDWITQYGTMLLAPLTDARFGLGAVFIIDLMLSATLLAALVLCALWPARRWPALLGLAAASAWVALAWVGKQEAEAAGAHFARERGIAVRWIDTMPRPASPFNWTVTVFDGDDYHVAHVNTRRTEPLLARADDHFIRHFSVPYQPLALAHWTRVPRMGGPGTPPWVSEAWEHEALAVYRWFALTPALLQSSERTAGDGQRERCAIFRDLRFEFPGRAESPFRYGICLPEAAPSSATAGISAGARSAGRVVRFAEGRMQPVR